MKFFLYVLNLLIPAVMAAAGYFMHHHPPKNINPIIGYRTTRSMRSMDAWLFANIKCGVLWERTGLIALGVCALLQIPFLFSSVQTLSVVSIILMHVQLVLLLTSFLPVERALKKEFGGSKEQK